MKLKNSVLTRVFVDDMRKFTDKCYLTQKIDTDLKSKVCILEKNISHMQKELFSRLRYITTNNSVYGKIMSEQLAIAALKRAMDDDCSFEIEQLDLSAFPDSFVTQQEKDTLHAIFRCDGKAESTDNEDIKADNEG